MQGFPDGVMKAMGAALGYSQRRQSGRSGNVDCMQFIAKHQRSMDQVACQASEPCS